MSKRTRRRFLGALAALPFVRVAALGEPGPNDPIQASHLALLFWRDGRCFHYRLSGPPRKNVSFPKHSSANGEATFRRLPPLQGIRLSTPAYEEV